MTQYKIEKIRKASCTNLLRQESSETKIAYKYTKAVLTAILGRESCLYFPIPHQSNPHKKEILGKSNLFARSPHLPLFESSLSL